jgi:hypothetical protein
MHHCFGTIVMTITTMMVVVMMGRYGVSSGRRFSGDDDHYDSVMIRLG